MKHIQTFEDYYPTKRLDELNPINAIRNNNDWKDYTEEEKEKKLSEIKEKKEDWIKFLEKFESNGGNLENYIIGYVLNYGGEHGLTTKSVVFAEVFPTENDFTSWVLCKVIDDSFMWLRYNNRVIKAGGCPECREEGIKHFRKLKEIKNNK